MWLFKPLSLWLVIKAAGITMALWHPQKDTCSFLFWSRIWNTISHEVYLAAEKAKREKSPQWSLWPRMAPRWLPAHLPPWLAQRFSGAHYLCRCCWYYRWCRWYVDSPAWASTGAPDPVQEERPKADFMMGLWRLEWQPVGTTRRAHTTCKKNTGVIFSRVTKQSTINNINLLFHNVLTSFVSTLT